MTADGGVCRNVGSEKKKRNTSAKKIKKGVDFVLQGRYNV